VNYSPADGSHEDIELAIETSKKMAAGTKTGGSMV